MWIGLEIDVGRALRKHAIFAGHWAILVSFRDLF